MSSALQPGQSFGRYQITRILGVGSFGIVYEAVQYPLERRVALKLLHDRTLTHPDALARFEREAMAAARMRHPHVVEVFDFGAHEGTAFLAMELLEGESLQALMRRSGALPQGLVVDLMLPIVAAVAAVHDQGIVHRDLKPENVLLTVTPERQWHPKLLDFGIAKVEMVGPELTRTNSLLGTPCYMSPEQVMQARSIDGRADQWSLGVVLYEAITGAKPFYSETLLVLMTAITSEDPVPPRLHRPDLDPGLEAVMLRALQRRPDDRYPTMRDLGSALLPYASEAAQAIWYEEFNESPAASPLRAPAPSRAPVAGRLSSQRPPSMVPAPMPSFATDEEATRARRESVEPVEEPTELVNTTSQDGEFPVGVARQLAAQSVQQAVSQSSPGVYVSQSMSTQLPASMQTYRTPPQHGAAPSQHGGPPQDARSPQDLFAQMPDREVGTGTLAMDIDTGPGRTSMQQGPAGPPMRPATSKMPAFKATMEMESPLVPMIQPASVVNPAPMGPYPPQYGMPGGPTPYPPPMHQPEAYPGGTFNLTSGEIARPARPASSRKGLVFALVAVVLGAGAFGVALRLSPARRGSDVPPAHPTARPVLPVPAANPMTSTDAAPTQPPIPATTDASAAPLDEALVALATDAGSAPALDAMEPLAVTPDAGVAPPIDAGVTAVAAQDVDASAPPPSERSARVRPRARDADAGARPRVRPTRPPRDPRGGSAPIF